VHNWLVVMYLGPTLGDLTLFTVDSTTGALAFNAAGMDLSGALQKGNNLSDLTSTSAARINLGLGALAVLSSVAGNLIALAGQMQSALMWLDSGVWKAFAPGAAGQFLISNGSTAAPGWAAGPAAPPVPGFKGVVFNASGTFVPTATTPHRITVVGGGAAGYAGLNVAPPSDGGPGGGAGGCAVGVQNLTNGTSYGVTVGPGGVAAPAGSGWGGGNGGASQFAGPGTITAYGGGASGGGAASGGSLLNARGQSGSQGTRGRPDTGGGADYGAGGVGGGGPWGGGGGGGGGAGGAGQVGGAPGAGGGAGSGQDGPSGAGAPGVVIIESLG
jgi:hypothetical protein